MTQVNIEASIGWVPTYRSRMREMLFAPNGRGPVLERVTGQVTGLVHRTGLPEPRTARGQRLAFAPLHQPKLIAASPAPPRHIAKPNR